MNKIIYAMLIIVTSTLAIILMAVVFVMLVGLFHPEVDNKEIFAIIGPAFQTIVGAFVGLLAAMALMIQHFAEVRRKSGERGSGEEE